MDNWRAASIRGKQSEDNARIVLKQLFKEGIITSYRQTEKFSVDDLNGIDFYFSLNIRGKRVEVPLQVKSSKAGVIANNERYGDIHAVNGQHPNLRKQIQGVINDYHNKLGGGKQMIETPFDVIEEVRKLELVSTVQNTVNPEDIILEVRDGKVWTTSLEIARVYEKEHHNVIQAIKNLDQSEEFIDLNFKANNYTDPRGRSLPMFYISKDGAYALCFKFQGKLAAQFREAFIKKFNEMEEQLRNPQPLQLSGNIADMLQLAADQLRTKDLIIQEKEQKLLTSEQEKLVLAEQNVKQYAVNVTLAAEAAAAESLLKKDHTLTITDAVCYYDLPIKRNDLFNALAEKGYIRRKVGDDKKARWFPYSQFRTETKPYFAVTPDYIDRNGNVHEGTLRITWKGLWKTYRDVCETLGYAFDPKVELKLKRLAEGGGDDEPPAAAGMVIRK